MPTNWNEIAAAAGQAADEHFSTKVSSLTRLNSTEIESIILDTGMSQEDLTLVLQTVQNATLSNLDKIQVIQRINGGVGALVGIASKLV